MNKPMRLFMPMEIREAKQYAMEGGQALHLHKFCPPNAPAPFRQAIAAGKFIAHLFDQDESRLRETVKFLGVRVIVVQKRGEPGQHVDLCQKPLRRAEEMCENQRATSPA